MSQDYREIPPRGSTQEQRVESYNNFVDFPISGELGVIYIDESSSEAYLFDGLVYVLQTGSAIVWGGITGTLSNQTDLSNALNAKEPTITASTTSTYYRGDKTFQTLDKTAVGLGNVDNTSDLSKPISTATQTALDARPAFQLYRTTSDVTGNTGVDTAVSSLSCTLAANKHYYIEVFVRATTVNAAVWVIQHRPTYTGTINALYATVGSAAVSNQNILSQPPASGFQLGVSTGANNTDFSPGHLMMSLSTGGSSTTFTYSFRSNNATSTTIKAGSFMRVTEFP